MGLNLRETDTKQRLTVDDLGFGGNSMAIPLIEAMAGDFNPHESRNPLIVHIDHTDELAATPDYKKPTIDQDILREKAANVLSGVKVICVVTGSASKLEEIRKWLNKVFGDRDTMSKIQVVGVSSSKQELKYSEAMLVAVDKVEADKDFSRLRGEENTILNIQAGYAYFGSDIVAQINDEHTLFNLSRNIFLTDLSSPTKVRKIIQEVENHILRLKAEYCRPEGSTVTYDAVLAMSTMNDLGEYCKSATGERIVVRLRQIPPEIIDRHYKATLDYLYARGAKKARKAPPELAITHINVGLPIVDLGSDINPFIESVERWPIRYFTDDAGYISNNPKSKNGNGLHPLYTYDFANMDDQAKAMALTEIGQCLVGGVPTNADLLFNGDCKTCEKKGWTFL